MEINVFNETTEDIKELELIKEIIIYTLTKEQAGNCLANIIIVNNQTIHDLNKKYRQIDRPTDVISFALEDEKNMVNASDTRILGDIYISVDKAHEQAIEYKHSFKREICFLAVHGIYHLLGYDHITKEDEKIMFNKQKEILDEYEIKG